MEIKKRVLEIIAEIECAPIEKLTPEIVIMDIGDSLEAIELLMALEEEFEIDIPDADAEKLITIGDIFEYIKSRKEN